MAVILPEMIHQNITRRDLLPLSFLKKSVYTGSKRKFNYKLEKTSVPVDSGLPGGEGAAQVGNAEAQSAGKPAGQAENEPETVTVLRVYSWFGPYSYEATDPAEIESRDFAFSDAGIDEAIDYLNGCLERGEAEQAGAAD